MKAVIHIGMPKTGTSSIQQTFLKRKNTEFTYLPVPSANPAYWLVLQFEDEAQIPGFNAFSLNGRERWSILNGRESELKRVESLLAEAKPDLLLISSEFLSGPEGAYILSNLKTWLESLGADVEVIGYIRRPVSFFQSLFQQLVKAGQLRRLHGENFSTSYRTRFATMDRIFGRSRVKLKLFDPARFPGGDVVLDMAQDLGANVAPDEIVRVNDAIPLNAAALLYVQRLHGDGFPGGFPGAAVQNDRFVERLVGLGGPKLTFGPELRARILERNAADIAWMEARMGESLAEAPSRAEKAIETEQDLIDIAVTAAPALEQLTRQTFDTDLHLPDHPTPARLAEGLDRLRHLTADPNLGQIMKRRRRLVEDAGRQSEGYGTCLCIDLGSGKPAEIRGFLRYYREDLRKLGYTLPAGQVQLDDHIELHAAAMRPGRLSTFRLTNGLANDTGPFAARIAAHLAETVAKDATEQPWLIFASDCGLLRHDDEFAWLKRHLPQPVRVIATYGDKEACLARIRRDIDVRLAEFMPLGDDPEEFYNTGPESWLIDYEARLAPFRRAFGDHAVQTIDVDRADSEDGGLLHAFAKALGLDLLPAEIQPPRS